MKFLDKCNAAYGAIVTVLVAILGPYWYNFCRLPALQCLGLAHGLV